MTEDEGRGEEDQVVVRRERDSEDGAREKIRGEGLSRERAVHGPEEKRDQKPRGDVVLQIMGVARVEVCDGGEEGRRTAGGLPEMLRHETLEKHDRRESEDDHGDAVRRRRSPSGLRRNALRTRRETRSGRGAFRRRKGRPSPRRGNRRRSSDRGNTRGRGSARPRARARGCSLRRGCRRREGRGRSRRAGAPRPEGGLREATLDRERATSARREMRDHPLEDRVQAHLGPIADELFDLAGVGDAPLHVFEAFLIGLVVRKELDLGGASASFPSPSSRDRGFRSPAASRR